MTRNRVICLYFIIGILVIIHGALIWKAEGSVYTHFGTSTGVFIPAWTGWPLIFLGIVMCVICIHGLWRGKGQPEPEPEKTDPDEAAARAKAELDRMYLKEYGSLPEAVEPPSSEEQTPPPSPPHPKDGLSLRRCLRFRDILDAVPYATILLMAKGKADPPAIPPSRQRENAAEALSKADLLFYAFMTNPKIRQGFHALAACLAVCLIITAGLDWGILHIAVAVLLLVGIAKVAGGSVDIL